MLNDKKRENMYFNCRIRKKKIDKQIWITRSGLLLPPLFMLISTIVGVVLSLLGDTAVLLTGAGTMGYQVMGTSITNLFTILMNVGICLFVAFLTVFDAEWARRFSYIIYAGGALIFFLLSAFFNAFTTFGFYFLYFGFGLLFIKLYKSLYAEDKKLSTLDGYPHFNSLLMKNNDEPEITPESANYDGMTPDERIMFERGQR